MATTICSLWAQNISIRPRASRLLPPPKGDCAVVALPLPPDAALVALPLAMDAADGDDAGCAMDEGEESAAMGVAAAAAMAICC